MEILTDRLSICNFNRVINEDFVKQLMSSIKETPDETYIPVAVNIPHVKIEDFKYDQVRMVTVQNEYSWLLIQ